jgi:thiamine-phosphate pyrophosphorylase
MSTLRTPRTLLALSPGRGAGPRDVPNLLRAIGRALEAGLPAVLLREPGLCDRDLLELARGAVRLRDRFDSSWIGVHDSVHVALAAGADGVHLGFRSLPLDEARRLTEGRIAVGFSAHEHDDRSSWELADYLTFGPVRETPSKAGILEPTGFEALTSAAGLAPCPLLALGGMRPEDVEPASRAGVAGIAVLSGILGSADPGARTLEYLSAFRGLEER